MLVPDTSLITDPNASIALEEYDVEYIPVEDAGAIMLGQGVDLTNLLEPSLAPQSPFLLATNNSRAEHENVALNDVEQHYLADANEEVVAMAMYLNFKDRLGISSFQAALDLAKKKQRTSNSIVYTLTNKRLGPPIPPAALVWWTYPVTEGIEDLAERKATFIENYGTHYISAIQYGFRVEILATCHTTDKNELDKFQAGFTAWTKSGKIGAQLQRSLRSSLIEIYCKVRSGGILHKDTKPRDITLTDFGEISNLLADINNGAVTILGAPIAYTATSYKGTLAGLPNSQEIFNSNTFNTQSTVTFRTQYPFTKIRLEEPSRFILTDKTKAETLGPIGVLDTQVIYFHRPADTSVKEVTVDISSPRGVAGLQIQTGGSQGRNNYLGGGEWPDDSVSP